MTALAPRHSVGVFDSGVGGLTVLRALHQRLPDASLLYAADSAFAPYGERDPDYVIRRSVALTRFLLERGAQAVVVACNTATALAIAELRRRWPQTPFVGIEPAIKPALAAAAGRVGVLATPATLASAKFQQLLRDHDAQQRVLAQPCPGLAEAIELQGPDAATTLALLRDCCAPLRAAHCTDIVLGCTHYPLLLPALRALFGADVRLHDPADAVAAQLERVLAPLSGSAAAPALQAWSNGDPAMLARIAAACGLTLAAQPLPAALNR